MNSVTIFLLRDTGLFAFEKKRLAIIRCSNRLEKNPIRLSPLVNRHIERGNHFHVCIVLRSKTSFKALFYTFKRTHLNKQDEDEKYE